jgi:hypothetical protein
MIIWLASYPRSGNTFFRVLLKHYYGLRTYTVYEDHQITDDWMVALRDVAGYTEKSRPLSEMAKAPETYFVKTHDLPHDDFPAIYLVRDGRDALVSYAWFTLSVDRGADNEAARTAFHDTLRNLIVSGEPFGGWGQNVLAWAQRQAPTVIIKFENLVTAPHETASQALAEIGYHDKPVKQQNAPSFDELHKQMPQFFRKGQIGGWQEEMPLELQYLFWEHHGDAMRKMGYT